MEPCLLAMVQEAPRDHDNRHVEENIVSVARMSRLVDMTEELIHVSFVSFALL